ncbi:MULTISPECIES: dTDP-4-dehydrorhamnose 3,5-epimerase family protein [Actinoalloteichus]|uniref:dTDP-4-dehydrorhamnose 3,5-epimerase-like enzyme n=1 Tax=Actinoalloteichus fjordicus TaxID=1612552 RepID=A0AAC9LA77_9PSEU|nr:MULTISPECIES: dTDP-4-dehydrorhamnose 3,5-epimerase family protein [Actinoalloteichus]APU13209.1 dTDP-4-dehydrorhamnose 3,5-epimerase-like enzyme [Actinoalloteichus fjordicus]APU19160.1 dTDP-4-dehydrorhamnose 3,5-epimerase-like enzyme [Actinoalloteichus sp. GBA129-24]
MKARELTVEGAFEFSPDVFPDERGEFVSHYQEPAFVAALGHPLFPIAQVSQSRSRRGVLRGIHFTRTPPGTAKYVHCPQGSALDFVVDLRLGSPTFGRWDTVALNSTDYRGVYFPPGVGHAFVALEDDTLIHYLLSENYSPGNELALSPFDPEIGLELPERLPVIQSERDRAALSLAEARAQGLLPDHAACLEIQQGYRVS